MPITLIQITDTHIHDQDNVNFKDTQPDIYLNRIIRHAQHKFKQIDCAVITGDLTHDGSSKACKKLAASLHLFDCPVYVTLGNHDFSTVILENLLDDHISMPENIELEHWQLLFADSHVEGKVSGFINQPTIQNIHHYLTKNTRPTLLFTHHPPMKVNSSWMDKIGLENGDYFLQQVSKHQQLCIISFGHIHQQVHKHYKHIQLYASPSSCVQFTPLSKEFAIDDTDPGYRVFILEDDGKYETKVFRCAMQIKKIVSGGQTGIDRAALDTAIELAIPHGGWCPKNRKALDGKINDKYQLTETPSENYPQRTQWNVRDSDATLILSWGKPDGGTALTCQLARNMDKPLFIIDLCNSFSIENFRLWLKQHQISTLNIAGPRHSKSPGIYDIAKTTLKQVLI